MFTKTARFFIHCTLLAVLSAPGQADEPLVIDFHGQDFIHRWSQAGQHEFTPEGQLDLAAWQEMITLNVRDEVTNEEALASLANGVLNVYQKHGQVIRTASVPRSDSQSTEHLAIAVMGSPEFIEAAFARFVFREGRGVIIVYSHRTYGDGANDAMVTWLQTNMTSSESRLMSWSALPGKASLDILPESK